MKGGQGDDGRAVGHLFDTAIAFHQRGELARAEHLYREILRQQPRHAEALNMLGVIGCQSGQAQGGAELIRRALALEPGNADFHNNLGQALLQSGDVATARTAFEAALAARRRFPEARFNLGNACRAVGDWPAAETAYRGALDLRPDYVDALVNLGNLLRERGRATEAIPLCRRVVALAPRFVGGLLNLGLALRAAGQYEEGATVLSQALGADPAPAGAWRALGDCRRALGDLAGAVEAHAAAVARAPGDVDARLAHGLGCYALGRVDEALASFEAAAARHPGQPLAAAYVGMAHAARGDGEAARTSLERALAIAPTCGEAWRHRVEACRDADEAAPLLQRLDTVRSDAPAHEQAALDYARGRLLDLCGRPAEAFAAWTAANAARRRAVPFDAAAQAAFIDSVVATFDSAFFAREAGRGPASDLPVFIVGMPRSGTTLVEQILASHPQVHGAGELTFFPAEVPRRAGRAGFPAAYAAGLDAVPGARELAARYLDLLASLAPDRRRVTDKMPYNFLYLGVIAALLPRARVVHCRRHPLATCFSLYTRELAGSHPYAHDLADLASAYAGYARLMAHWHAVLPVPLLDLDYEALVEDAEGQVRRLLAFLQLPWDPACLAFHRSARRVTTASQWQVRRPLYREGLDHWRHHATALAPLRAALASHGVAAD